VTPPKPEQTLGCGTERIQAGDGERDFLTSFVTALDRPLQLADLLQARPIQLMVATVGSAQPPRLGAVAVLVVFDRLSDLNLPELLFRGGERAFRTPP